MSAPAAKGMKLDRRKLMIAGALAVVLYVFLRGRSSTPAAVDTGTGTGDTALPADAGSSAAQTDAANQALAQQIAQGQSDELAAIQQLFGDFAASEQSMFQDLGGQITDAIGAAAPVGAPFDPGLPSDTGGPLPGDPGQLGGIGASAPATPTTTGAFGQVNPAMPGNAKATAHGVFKTPIGWANAANLHRAHERGATILPFPHLDIRGVMRFPEVHIATRHKYRRTGGLVGSSAPAAGLTVAGVQAQLAGARGR